MNLGKSLVKLFVFSGTGIFKKIIKTLTEPIK
jgi:hypothetical protein